MRQTLIPGLEIKLERSHDISAVIHADRTADGRILITAMPLLYGTYTVTRGTGTFSLEPPLDLNLAAGWPLFKPEQLRGAENRFAEVRQRETPGRTCRFLVSLPRARRHQLRISWCEWSRRSPSIRRKRRFLHQHRRKQRKAKRSRIRRAGKKCEVSAGRDCYADGGGEAIAVLYSSSFRNNCRRSGDAGRRDAGFDRGGWDLEDISGWPYPLGRLIAAGDLPEIADRGLAGERIYLKGQFVVNFSDANKAVLRPRSRMPESVMRLAGGNSPRIIVEYPAATLRPLQVPMLIAMKLGHSKLRKYTNKRTASLMSSHAKLCNRNHRPKRWPALPDHSAFLSRMTFPSRISKVLTRSLCRCA